MGQRTNRPCIPVGWKTSHYAVLRIPAVHALCRSQIPDTSPPQRWQSVSRHQPGPSDRVQWLYDGVGPGRRDGLSWRNCRDAGLVNTFHLIASLRLSYTQDIVSLLLLLSSLPHYKEVRTLIVRQIVSNRVKVTR